MKTQHHQLSLWSEVFPTGMNHVNSEAPPTLQVLNDPPQTVSMGCDEHPLSLFDLRGDLLVPVWQRPCDGVLKALAGRKLVVCQVCIATILRGTQSQCVNTVHMYIYTGSLCL